MLKEFVVLLEGHLRVELALPERLLGYVQNDGVDDGGARNYPPVDFLFTLAHLGADFLDQPRVFSFKIIVQVIF